MLNFVVRPLDRSNNGLILYYTLFEIPKLRPVDETKILDSFRDLRNKKYEEIVEECETKFVKEIEFERVVACDWFGANRRRNAESWIEKCQGVLDVNGEEMEV